MHRSGWKAASPEGAPGGGHVIPDDAPLERPPLGVEEEDAPERRPPPRLSHAARISEHELRERQRGRAAVWEPKLSGSRRVRERDVRVSQQQHSVSMAFSITK